MHGTRRAPARRRSHDSRTANNPAACPGVYSGNNPSAAPAEAVADEGATRLTDLAGGGNGATAVLIPLNSAEPVPPGQPTRNETEPHPSGG